ncbi:ureidoglycolate lyase [Flexibacterium corallicola]|uniref:ureidoglycolate lyase n=1 Tax=Flexibacterium corallicola TaxID=3037259 RepID=UPI00286F287D|nr:ureidoglycolate lyase [Pseudovibrio sp. M1P-2-3]
MSDEISEDRIVRLEELSAEAFQKFGDVVEVGTVDPVLINEKRCLRYSDLAEMEYLGEGRAGVSLFHADIREIPYKLSLLERHPLGSQCFVPMNDSEYMVIVAEDDGGRPAKPRAFLVSNSQSINFRRNTWHGVLTPLKGTGLFAVIDRIGVGNNLEEYRLDEPYFIVK